MTADAQQLENSPARRGIRGIHIFWIVLATIILTAAVTYWVVRTYIYAKDFEPVVLSAQEEQTLNSKLRMIGYEPGPAEAPPAQSDAPAETDEQWLQPQPYSELGAEREVSFSERELNAMVAKNPELAKKLAVDLSDDLVSVRVLVPVDQDFPLLGGKTLRVAAGVEMAYRESKPIVVLKGVSVMGVPIPSAWLGGLKNIDLVREFGDEQGFWQSFAAGVEDIRVAEGKLNVQLKE